MNKQKSLLVRMIEVVGLRCAERCADAPWEARAGQRGRLDRLLRWLLPNGGTLVLVALLVVTAQAWAKPLVSPL